MLCWLGAQSTGRQRAILVVACVVLYLLWPLPAPLTNVDEARYSEASREMLESGNFILPHHNYEPRYQKPVMIYWLQAGSMALLGPTPTAARLPSAVAGIALVLLVHWFLLRWLPLLGGDEKQRRGIAFLGSCALMTMPLLSIWTRVATTDVVLTLFTTGSLLALMHAQLLPVEQARGARRAYIIASGCAALAFLTKGPVGVAIPVGAWLAFVLLQRSLWAECRRIPWVWVMLTFVAIAAPWYVATYIVDGPNFMKQFFFTENVDRFTGKDAAAVPVPRVGLLLSYVPICYLFVFPWSVFLVRDLRRPLGGSELLSRDAVAVLLRRFCWVWMAVVIVIFSLSRNQSPNYVQSIVAAAAIVLSLHLLGRLSGDDAGGVRISWGEIVGLGIGMAIWVGLVAWVVSVGSVQRPLVFPPLMGLPNSQPFPVPLAGALMFASIVLGAMLLTVFSTPRVPGREANAFLLTTGVWLAFTAVFVMGFSPMLSNSAHALSVEAGASLRDFPHDTPIWVYTEKRQDVLVFYAQRRLELLSREKTRLSEELRRTPPPDSGLIIVTDDRGVEEARSVADVEVLRRFGATSLLRVRTRAMVAVADRGQQPRE